MIVIVDYGLGNLASVLNMFKKAGVRDVVISKDSDVISKADKIILPGVGAFDAGMINLEQSGLIPLLNQKVLNEKRPVLGICLGMQLLSRRSEEGQKAGLGWIDAETIKFNLDPALKLKVPHMGWDYIKVKRENALIDLNSRSRFYFVHSYHVKCFDANQSLATCNFGEDFTCMVNKDNIYGTQFHPEKSLKFGMKILENFAKL
ncbi:MAG: imidazole glycerol phosphate synthase subunit HisH [Bacteroidia bacterium]|nr:imidazole glycerol phosphate synthase subunit HisH [Bacteroidia bacterium]